MWCGICDKHLSECTCEDINERLKSVASTGVLAYRKCNICGKHYSLCKCPDPQWGIEHNSKPQQNEIKKEAENGN